MLRGTGIVFEGNRFIVTKRIVFGGSTVLKANDSRKKEGGGGQDYYLLQSF